MACREHRAALLSEWLLSDALGIRKSVLMGASVFLKRDTTLLLLDST